MRGVCYPVYFNYIIVVMMNSLFHRPSIIQGGSSQCYIVFVSSIEVMDVDSSYNDISLRTYMDVLGLCTGSFVVRIKV